jgi:hypothetical protein
LAADDLAVDNALAILQVRQYYFSIERERCWLCFCYYFIGNFVSSHSWFHWEKYSVDCDSFQVINRRNNFTKGWALC